MFTYSLHHDLSRIPDQAAINNRNVFSSSRERELTQSFVRGFTVGVKNTL